LRQGKEVSNPLSPPRNHCIRCGECCRRSSPSLQWEDLTLLEKDLIEKRTLFTVRKGEMVRDNIRGCLVVVDTEIVKVKEMEEGGCLLYDDLARACRIYPNRPVQCAALKCWDPREFEKVFKGAKIRRSDIVSDPVLLGLIQQHERRCSFERLESHVKRIQVEGERALGAILEFLRFDFEIRPFVSHKLGIPFEEMDLVFGRPLIKTITRFGLQVIRQPDGAFFLTILKSPAGGKTSLSH